MPLDLFYLTNPTGLIAVSHDQGETMITPSGKVMPVNAHWDEVSDDLYEQLTEKQRDTLQMLTSQPEPTGMDKILQDYQKRRDIQEKKDGIVHEKPRPLPLSDRVAVVKPDK